MNLSGFLKNIFGSVENALENIFRKFDIVLPLLEARKNHQKPDTAPPTKLL